jgi:hypothetical protein
MNRYSPWFEQGFGPADHHGPDPLQWAIFALLLLLVLALAGYVATRIGGRPRPRQLVTAGAGVPGDPVQVLRMRYARGELSRDDFLQGMNDLGAAPTAPPPEPPDEAPTQHT